MKKSAVITAVMHKTGVSRADAKKVVDAIFNPHTGIIATELVKESGAITIGRFGTFQSVIRQPRKGVDVETGVFMTFPAKKDIKFRPGDLLRDNVRASRKEEEELSRPVS